MCNPYAGTTPESTDFATGMLDKQQTEIVRSDSRARLVPHPGTQGARIAVSSRARATGKPGLASGQRADVAQERLDPKRRARGLLD